MPCGVDPVSFDKDLMSNISKRKMHRVADSSKTTIYSIATTGKTNDDEKAIKAYQKTPRKQTAKFKCSYHKHALRGLIQENWGKTMLKLRYIESDLYNNTRGPLQQELSTPAAYCELSTF